MIAYRNTAVGGFDDGVLHIGSVNVLSSRCRDVEFDVPHRSGYHRAAADRRDVLAIGWKQKSRRATTHVEAKLDANDRECLCVSDENLSD